MDAATVTQAHQIFRTGAPDSKADDVRRDASYADAAGAMRRCPYSGLGARSSRSLGARNRGANFSAGGR